MLAEKLDTDSICWLTKLDTDSLLQLNIDFFSLSGFSQVHNKKILLVPFAILGRDNIDMNVVGMKGIPEADRKGYKLQNTGWTLCFVYIQMFLL